MPCGTIAKPWTGAASAHASRAARRRDPRRARLRAGLPAGAVSRRPPRSRPAGEPARRGCQPVPLRRGVPVAIGGVHVTNDVERVLDDIPAARFAFLREADRSVQVFVRVVRGELGVDALGQVILADGVGGRHRFLDGCQPTAAVMDVISAFELTEIGELNRYGIVVSFPYFKTPGPP